MRARVFVSVQLAIIQEQHHDNTITPFPIYTSREGCDYCCFEVEGSDEEGFKVEGSDTEENREFVAVRIFQPGRNSSRKK